MGASLRIGWVFFAAVSVIAAVGPFFTGDWRPIGFGIMGLLVSAYELWDLEKHRDAESLRRRLPLRSTVLLLAMVGAVAMTVVAVATGDLIMLGAGAAAAGVLGYGSWRTSRTKIGERPRRRR